MLRVPPEDHTAASIAAQAAGKSLNQWAAEALRLVHGVVLLLVAHAYTEADGDETIRIISARMADKAERRIYAEGH